VPFDCTVKYTLKLCRPLADHCIVTYKIHVSKMLNLAATV